MTQDVSKPASTGLAKDLASKLMTGIEQSNQQTVIPGGQPFLRLGRDGSWIYGQNDEQVQEGSSWAGNPLSIQHGFCAWTRHDDGKTPNTLVGEVMKPIYETMPARPEPVSGWPFVDQRAIQLKCLDGEDAGVEVLYKTNSVGGMRAFKGLLNAIHAQLQKDAGHPCPVLQLDADSYKHKTWGQIQVPILTIVGWADMTGKLAANGGAPQRLGGEDEETEDQGETVLQNKPAPAPAPAPARKASLRAVPSEPEPTSRRRPVRR